MTLHSLPLFARLAGRPVILVGEGHIADAKRRLIERAGGLVVSEENAEARFAFVVGDEAAAIRLRARGLLVNMADRPDLCDFTMPAIVERGDVVVAVGTGGASAGLSAQLRQRLETWLPAGLGALAAGLKGAREAIHARWPDFDDRRRAIGAALAEGGPLDPFAAGDVDAWLASTDTAPQPRLVSVTLASADPDDLTLRAARALGLADRIYHSPEVPAAILDRARGDAERIVGTPPADPLPGLSVALEIAE
ncbi:siroheme synthase [Sphingomonas cannabina]|uniref:precorrin-2 dehydrogenase/sirohydrochlorin ferrochelatase family protein n=1 Tax=Sphingomonas cannabina TaxID=2899123 RepID=UPI001F2377DC|nr:siroheme synthase [Sphingomonas cannabina]UIJ47491.1 siroheme synthase [Sphingomonas cannabina]